MEKRSFQRRAGALASVALILSGGTLSAQTFTVAGAAIPDDGNFVEIPLVVSGLPTTIDTVGFGLESVCFSADHTWISDLDVSIIAPDGTTKLLVSGQGGDTDAFTNTCFNTDASTTIGSGDPPYTGSFVPQGQMGMVNNGQNPNGTWRLHVQDTYPFADTGWIIGWSITFGSVPATYFNFQSSDLPLMVINTEGQTIVDGTKIDCAMGIVDNGPGLLNHPVDPFNSYEGRIGIELRGSSSQYLSPKKSYSLELRDVFGDDLDTTLLGMSSDADWVLSANYFDKSFMNNSLTYHLARQMGRYAPRTRHIEVVVNGEYVGIYVLTERIKRGPDRVDIAKLTEFDVAGDDLSGGYILSVDRNEGSENGFISAFPPVSNGNGQETYFHYRYPKGDDIQPEQVAYIEQYVNAFESALAGPQFTDPILGYRFLADASSFADLFLINELSRNVDGYRLSSYLYKDKDSNGGQLHAGPAWDYDIAWGNANYCQGSDIDGWAYEFGDVCGGDGNQIPFWWPRFLEDPQFVADLRCRWNELRSTVLSTTNINHFCDSVATLLASAQVRNFSVWPTLGQYVWPNPSPIPATFAGEVQELKSWAAARRAWMNTHLPGTCTIGVPENGSTTPNTVFPVPFTDHVWISDLGGGIFSVRLLDTGGREIYAQQQGRSGTGPQRVALPEALAPGIYLLQVQAADGSVRTHRVQH